MEFDTIEYVKSHGREPRGRGGWAFSDVRNPSHDVPNGEPGGFFWAPSGTYAEAKRAAREHYRGKASVVYVQP